MKQVIAFDHKANDWISIKKFATEQDAEAFIQNYPLFGAEHSRKRREGNWQIIPA